MAGSFFRRTDELLDRVGDGELVGITRFEQPYADVQHKGGWENYMGRYGPKDIENHPGGGGPPPSLYLAETFEETYPELMQDLADAVLDGDLVLTMASGQEDLAAAAAERAPRRSGRLAGSSAVSVMDGGAPVYERPSDEPRR